MEQLETRLARIKMLVMDVDGVLTDAGMYYSERGDELKKFNTRDGKGIELLQKAGIPVAIITSENSKIVARRAEKLKIKELFQGVQDKLPVLRELAARYALQLQQMAYIGDDVNDLEVMRAVGMAVAVADALPQVKETAHYVTGKQGGQGAVREFIELLLQAKNKVTASCQKTSYPPCE